MSARRKQSGQLGLKKKTHTKKQKQNRIQSLLIILFFRNENVVLSGGKKGYQIVHFLVAKVVPLSHVPLICIFILWECEYS